MFANEIQEGSTKISFYGLAKRGVEPNDVSSPGRFGFGRGTSIA